MYRLKIIQYKGEFSILMEFSTLRYFDTKNSSDFNSFSSPLLPSCVNSLGTIHELTRKSRTIKRPQNTRLNAQKQDRCMYTRRKYRNMQNFRKIRRFSSIQLSTSYTFHTLCSKYFLLHHISIPMSNLYAFIASWHICLTSIRLIRMLGEIFLSKNLRYFRNSIRSPIHLFNPRVTFTRIVELQSL